MPNRAGRYRDPRRVTLPTYRGESINKVPVTMETVCGSRAHAVPTKRWAHAELRPRAIDGGFVTPHHPENWI